MEGKKTQIAYGENKECSAETQTWYRHEDSRVDKEK